MPQSSAVALLEPAGQKKPAAQGGHEASAVYVTPPSEYVPAGQGYCVAEAVLDGQ